MFSWENGLGNKGKNQDLHVFSWLHTCPHTCLGQVETTAICSVQYGNFTCYCNMTAEKILPKMSSNQTRLVVTDCVNGESIYRAYNRLLISHQYIYIYNKVGCVNRFIFIRQWSIHRISLRGYLCRRIRVLSKCGCRSVHLKPSNMDLWTSWNKQHLFIFDECTHGSNPLRKNVSGSCTHSYQPLSKGPCHGGDEMGWVDDSWKIMEVENCRKRENTFSKIIYLQQHITFTAHEVVAEKNTCHTN